MNIREGPNSVGNYLCKAVLWNDDPQDSAVRAHHWIRIRYHLMQLI